MDKCPICKSKKSEFLGFNPDFKTFPIVQCKNCQLFYTQIDDFSEIEKFYHSTYREIRQETPTEEYIKSQDKRALAQLFFILQNTTLKMKNLNVLECGCGAGSFLKLLDNGQNHLFAFEPDKNMANFAKQRIPNLTIWNTSFDFEKIKDKKFDLIFLSHVFEHMENPTLFLSQAKEVLSDNGAIFIEVPNTNKKAVMNTIRYRKGLGHFLFFNPKTLKKISGLFFSKIYINTYTYPLNKYLIRKHLDGTDMSIPCKDGIHIRCVMGNSVYPQKNNKKRWVKKFLRFIFSGWKEKI